MNIGDRVILVTFNGLTDSSRNIDSTENYWKLINKKGVVVKDPAEQGKYASFSKEKKLLVKFDDNLEELNLNAHNNIENALWILETDLSKVVKRGVTGDTH